MRMRSPSFCLKGPSCAADRRLRQRRHWAAALVPRLDNAARRGNLSFIMMIRSLISFLKLGNPIAGQ
jgi:hypothetical protein